MEAFEETPNNLKMAGLGSASNSVKASTHQANIPNENNNINNPDSQ
jgi:hypothetical protein